MRARSQVLPSSSSFGSETVRRSESGRGSPSFRIHTKLNHKDYSPRIISTLTCPWPVSSPTVPHHQSDKIIKLHLWGDTWPAATQHQMRMWLGDLKSLNPRQMTGLMWIKYIVREVSLTPGRSSACTVWWLKKSESQSLKYFTINPEVSKIGIQNRTSKRAI